jgi:hypothetical protein
MSSSIGIATFYVLDGRGLIPGRNKRFSLLDIVQTDSGAHPAPYSMGIGINRPGREADHYSPPLMPRSRIVELYLHSLTSFHGVVLN